MFKRTLIAWCFAPVLLTGVAFAAQKYYSTEHALRAVTMYSGEVNSGSADRFVHLVSQNVDRVIGLKISIEPSDESDFSRSGYIADVDGPTPAASQLVISKSDPEKGGIEVVTNGSVGRDAGKFLVDGFFTVKSGGMHQGIASFGLQPVDEANVRLNPSVKISERPF